MEREPHVVKTGMTVTGEFDLLIHNYDSDGTPETGADAGVY